MQLLTTALTATALTAALTLSPSAAQAIPAPGHPQCDWNVRLEPHHPGVGRYLTVHGAITCTRPISILGGHVDILRWAVSRSGRHYWQQQPLSAIPGKPRPAVGARERTTRVDMYATTVSRNVPRGTYRGMITIVWGAGTWASVKTTAVTMS